MVAIDKEKLRRARTEASPSQMELAIAAGVGYSTIWVLESGRQIHARAATVRRIAAALGRSPASLAPDSPSEQFRDVGAFHSASS